MRRRTIEHGRRSDRWARKRRLSAVALAVAIVGLAVTDAQAAAPFRPGVVLVGFRPGVSAGERYWIERRAGGYGARQLGPSVRLGRAGQRPLTAPLQLRVPAGQVLAVASRLRRSPAVAYAEPDYLMRASAAPNDPFFGLQWGDYNTGQAIPTQEANEVLGPEANGTPGADDRALKAWAITTGSPTVVIGETDTGVDYEHPDLAANVWSNPGGVGGCAAGTRGYSVLTHTCNPMDDDTYYGGHGSHVAGILGAVANNGIGVAGMNWKTSILPVKWLNSSASGETSGLIEALQWLVRAKQEGVNVRVINDSATFWGTAYSEALREEIDILGANEILFVTAAGNTGNNNDELSVRRYPCGYDRPNELCVTASNNNDTLPSWANYGPHTVDLAAPGVSIYSTLREGKYGYLSGGSMASPQVAGAAALILSAQPAFSATGLKADIDEHVDKLASMSGLLIAGGRLNVCKALPGCEEATTTTQTFGKTSVGSLSDKGIFSNYKVVHAATLPVAGAVSKLTLYAIPGVNSPNPETLKALIYADENGLPGKLMAVGSEVVYQGNVNGSGWIDLPLSTPVALAAGNYWLGFITGGTSEGLGYVYDSVSASRAYNANSYSSGPTDPFGAATKDSEQASIYATYTPASAAAAAPPANTALPTISGTAETGRTLTASAGSWTESPTSYAYQWERCDSTGANCANVSGATSSSYLLGSADAGCTMRVAVTATNSAGASAPATSAQTAIVQQAPATFGKTTVGPYSDTFSADRKRVNKYALTTSGTVTKLAIYLAPTGTSGQQVMKGIVYSDSSGKPANLLGITSQFTFYSTNKAGWYTLNFPAALSLPAGNYWIGVITGATGKVAGFRYEKVTSSRDYNSNSYTSGPTSTFGSYSVDSEQMSLYATYTP